MRIERRYTKDGQSPYADIAFRVTVSEIRSRLRRLKSTHGLGICYIDYLQLVRPSALGRNVNRNEELSEICRTLKATAKDLEIPIVALAQLNRAVDALRGLIIYNRYVTK